MDPLSAYYLWLMPEDNAYSRFDHIIRELSATYKTPVFEPHVTLVTGLTGPDDVLVNNIDAFARGKPAIDAAVEGADYEYGFFHALFLTIRNTPELGGLNAQALEALHPFGQKPYRPHLSLLYGDITPEEKEQVIAGLNILPHTFTLDKLKLVHGSSDVSTWRTVGEWKLA